MVRVRRATENDVEWMAQVSRSSFAQRLHPYLISVQPGIDRYWNVVLTHPASFPERSFLVAETPDGKRLGFADLQEVDPHRAHLSYVCVIESARGQGVGRALLREYVVAHPTVAAMQLDVFADNEAARALYDRLGFEVDSTTTWWVGDLEQVDAIADPDVRVEGLHGAIAWQDTYGFGELSVRSGGVVARLGLPSRGVLRCYEPELLTRPGVLAAVAKELRNVRHVLVVAPGENAPTSHVALRAVNRSIRMSATAIRAIVEPT